MQKKIDELDSKEFGLSAILLKWQNTVLEIKMKLNYYDYIKNALVVSKKIYFRIWVSNNGLNPQNGFPDDSEMQAKSEEAANNQMLSLSIVAAQRNSLQTIGNNLNALKRYFFVFFC